MFKKIFGVEKNSDLLKDLLQSILTEIEIKEVEIEKDVTLERKMITDKLGILDIVATLNDGIKVNIEMQMDDNKNTVERSLFYTSGIYHENLKAGEDYIEIPKTISIWITNYDVFEEGPYHERARLKRDYKNIILTNTFELHYIELSKFKKKSKRISNKLEEWLTFIINENKEEIAMSTNKYVKKAEKELEYLTGDAEAKRLAYLREKAIRDEQAAIAGATRRGREEGIKEGREKGIKEGIKEGIQTGIQKGIKTNRIEIAKKMLSEKIDINIIIKITELTKEEIEDIKNNTMDNTN